MGELKIDDLRAKVKSMVCQRNLEFADMSRRFKIQIRTRGSFNRKTCLRNSDVDLVVAVKPFGHHILKDAKGLITQSLKDIIGQEFQPMWHKEFQLAPFKFPDVDVQFDLIMTAQRTRRVA